MARVKLGLTGLSATELVAKAQSVHDAVNGNAEFPNPVPPSAELQTLIDRLASANAAVENNRGRKEYRDRDLAATAVQDVLRQWGGYVQMQSGGDAAIIGSSGFEVARRGAPIGELPPPRNLGARLTNFSGRAALLWDRESGSDMHHVYMSTSNDPFVWELVGVTTKSRYNVDGLQPGTFYWFAVSAIGAAGETSKSDVVRVMAAA